MGKLINRIPGSRLLISSLPGSALRQASRCQQAFSKPCLVNLISKDTHLVFSMYIPFPILKVYLKHQNQPVVDHQVQTHLVLMHSTEEQKQVTIRTITGTKLAQNFREK